MGPNMGSKMGSIWKGPWEALDVDWAIYAPRRVSGGVPKGVPKWGPFGGPKRGPKMVIFRCYPIGSDLMDPKSQDPGYPKSVNLGVPKWS